MIRTLKFVLLTLLLGTAANASANNGWIQTRSAHNTPQTMQRLEKAVTQKGLKIFILINHAAGAARVGLKLRPTELLIFGNPEVGTHLMECNQIAGIDLPLKMLVWTDAHGHTWIGYTSPLTIERRDDAGHCPIVLKMRKAMATIAKRASR